MTKKIKDKSSFKGDLTDAAKALLKPIPLGRASLRGVDIVTIPLAEYSALLADHEELARIVAKRPKGLPRSPIARNPDLRAFVEERFGKMELSEIAVACAEQFSKKAPSKSAIHRFLHRDRSV